MSFFSNLKTRTKLFLSFGAILVITAIMGINGLFIIRDMQSSFEEFYNDRFVSNMLLAKLQVNQEKISTEMQRVLYKAQAMQSMTVIQTAIGALNELEEEAAELINEYEAKELLPEKKNCGISLKPSTLPILTPG